MFALFRFALAALFFFPVFSHSQSIKEFVVTNDSDTVYGAVSFNRNSPASVSIRRADDKSLEEFTASEIRFFYLKSMELFESIAKQESDQWTFLRVLAMGKMSLYKLTKGYLIIKEGREYLLDKRDTVINNHLHEDKKYTGLLKILAADCEKLANATRSLSYNDDALAGFINKYNDCGEVTKVQDSRLSSRADGMIIMLKGGVSSSKLVFPAEGGYYSRYDFDRVISPVYGLSIGTQIARRVALSIDFTQVRERGAEVKGRETSYSALPATEDIYFRFRYGQVGLLGQYFFGFRKIKPFLTTRIFFGWASNVESVRRLYVTSGETQYTTRKDLDLSSSNAKKEFGYSVGAGVNASVTERVVLAFNYSFEKAFANPWANNDRFNFLSHYMTISAGYKLNRFL